MPALPDPKVSPQDVAQIVADKNKIFQPEGPRIPGLPEYENLPSNATPANMKKLLEELTAYTEAVQKAADTDGLTGDAVQSQWVSDMSNWRARLGHYYEMLKAVPPAEAGTLAGADMIYFTVTSPLLDGYFYEALPGIVLNEEELQRMKGSGPSAVSNKKPPDVYLPFTLGNQVLEYRKHQQERWDKFWDDIAEGIAKIPEVVKDVGWSVAPWLIGLGVFVGSTALAGALIYGIVWYRHLRFRPRAPAPAAPRPAPRAGVIQTTA